MQSNNCVNFNNFFQTFKSFKRSMKNEIIKNHNKEPQAHENNLKRFIQIGFINGMKLLCDEEFNLGNEAANDSFIFSLALYLALFGFDLIELENINFSSIYYLTWSLKRTCHTLIKDFNEKSSEWLRAFLFYKLIFITIKNQLCYRLFDGWDEFEEFQRNLQSPLDDFLRAEMMTLNSNYDLAHFQSEESTKIRKIEEIATIVYKISKAPLVFVKCF